MVFCPFFKNEIVEAVVTEVNKVNCSLPSFLPSPPLLQREQAG